MSMNALCLVFEKTDAGFLQVSCFVFLYLVCVLCSNLKLENRFNQL